MYTVTKQSDKCWEVQETTTDQTVYEVCSEKKARALVRSLNLGSGFNGFTPQFMSVNYLSNKQKERPSNK